MLPKTSVYVKSDDGHTKWMYFLTEDDGLLEKYKTIWDKIKIEFVCKKRICKQTYVQ